uniref:Uncharacterized protein n=1 Tax=Fagus sylvatica TaxID=28930 RepID=A0A2N9G8T1_FAGSY
MSDFDVLGTVGKLALPTFARFLDLRKSELGLARYGPANGGHRSVFGPFEDSFPIGIPASPGRLCAQAWQRRWENSGTFSKTLFRRPVFTRMVDVAPDVGFRRSWYRRKAYATYFPKVQALHRGELGFARYDLANRGRRNVPYAKGFDHNSLVSRPFLARKVSNRSSHHVLQNGQGAVSSIQLSVWSTVRSNLGQTWLTLVKLGRIWSKPSKFWEMCPGPHFECFWAWWTLVGLETARSNLGQTLVNPGQTWSTLVKLLRTLGNVSWVAFRGFSGIVGPRRVRNGLVNPWSNLVNPGQPGQPLSNLVKPPQTLEEVLGVAS